VFSKGLVKVIDNTVSEGIFEMLEKKFIGEMSNIAWFFVKSSAYSVDKEDRPEQSNFKHMAYTEGVRSPLYDFCIVPLMEALHKSDMKLKELLRIHIGLHTHYPTKVENDIHVDTDEDHMVGIFYLDNADGDTVLFNETRTDGKVMFEDIKSHASFTEYKRVSPKKNRFIIFDGVRYHRSSRTTKNIARIIINYNFTIEK
jgi:hypothetical protein